MFGLSHDVRLRLLMNMVIMFRFGDKGSIRLLVNVMMVFRPRHHIRLCFVLNAKLGLDNGNVLGGRFDDTRRFRTSFRNFTGLGDRFGDCAHYRNTPGLRLRNVCLFLHHDRHRDMMYLGCSRSLSFLDNTWLNDRLGVEVGNSLRSSLRTEELRAGNWDLADLSFGSRISASIRDRFRDHDRHRLRNYFRFLDDTMIDFGCRKISGLGFRLAGFRITSDHFSKRFNFGYRALDGERFRNPDWYSFGDYVRLFLDTWLDLRSRKVLCTCLWPTGFRMTRYNLLQRLGFRDSAFVWINLSHSCRDRDFLRLDTGPYKSLDKSFCNRLRTTRRLLAMQLRHLAGRKYCV